MLRKLVITISLIVLQINCYFYISFTTNIYDEEI